MDGDSDAIDCPIEFDYSMTDGVFARGSVKARQFDKLVDYQQKTTKNDINKINKQIDNIKTKVIRQMIDFNMRPLQ